MQHFPVFLVALTLSNSYMTGLTQDITTKRMRLTGDMHIQRIKSPGREQAAKLRVNQGRWQTPSAGGTLVWNCMLPQYSLGYKIKAIPIKNN